MTVIRSSPSSHPNALDITRLDLGPPLADTPKPDRPPSESRALVAYRPGTDVADHDPAGAGRAIGALDAITRKDTPPQSLPAPEKGDASINVRYMSPRAMQEFSQDLYAAGLISFEDYEALAFQPDLHPDFDRTIGALTGERAQPDRPRDFIRKWEDQLEFAQRYYPSNSNEVRQAFRITEVLKAYPRRIDIFA